MLVSGGYPGHYEKGKEISGLGKITDGVVFHAGTKISDNRVVTSGGRVLAVSSWGTSMKEALEGSYRNARLLSFDNMYYRTDIGFDLTH
jgi:phosphoribosylamine--glycine ligase